jgi:hypothetical protein
MPNELNFLNYLNSSVHTSYCEAPPPRATCEDRVSPVPRRCQNHKHVVRIRRLAGGEAAAENGTGVIMVGQVIPASVGAAPALVVTSVTWPTAASSNW